MDFDERCQLFLTELDELAKKHNIAIYLESGEGFPYIRLGEGRADAPPPSDWVHLSNQLSECSQQEGSPSAHS